MKELLIYINEYKPLIYLLNGLVGPVLAATVAYIAYQQWKTNDRKEKRETRGIKISIYKRIKSHLHYIDTTREVRKDLYEEFKQAYAEADFVFHKKLDEFLSEIDINSFQWLSNKEDLDCAAPDADQQSIEKLHCEMESYIDILQNSHCELYEKFSKHIPSVSI
ncbi:MAG: hypothetical protein IEMM0007_1299 [bacterium]|nr:MAG: hypothetical protein IEMM0007_1299 [bacterium]